MGDSGQPTSKPPLGQAPLELTTLGAVALVRPGGEMVLPVSKPVALLAYLIAAPGGTATRDHLASLLWGDSPTQRALASLRTTLHRLRSALGDHAPEAAGPIIRIGVPVAADFQVFEAALAAGDLGRAVDLYTGPFFREFSDAGTREFEDWAALIRTRLQVQFLRAGETCVAEALARGNAREAARLASLVKRHAPRSEASRRLLLSVHLATGRRLEAGAEAAELSQWLDTESRIAEPATAHLIHAATDAASESGPAQPGPAPFLADLVGREREFSRIMDAWASAERGQGRHLHLVAPPGLGKSRLLSDVGRRLVTVGAQVVRLRAHPGERTVDYSLAAELTKALAELPGAGGIPKPSLAVLIGLQPAIGLRYPTIPPASPAEDLLLQRTQAAAELLAAVTEQRPVALLVDDMHWADAPSRQLLVSLSERLDRHRILLLTAARPARIASEWAERTVTIPALSRLDVEDLLQSLGTWDSTECAQQVAKTLHEASAGSPLLCLEALQLAREQGDLTLREGRWSSHDPARLLTRLRSSRALTVRLGSLEHSHKRVLLLLATAGIPLTIPRLISMAGTGGPSVHATLETLEQLGHVIQSVDGWEVVHDAVAEAITQVASLEARQEAHAGVGRALASEPLGPSTGARRVARHLLEGDARPELRSWFAKWVAEARKRGDATPAVRLAAELLGETADPGICQELVSALPPGMDRIGRFRRPSTALLAALVLLVAAAAGWGLLGAPVAAPDAELVVSDSAEGGRMALYRVPIWKSRWREEEPITPRQGRLIGYLPAGSEPYRWVVPAPDGKHFAYERVMSDSGGIDLYVWSAEEGLRRLTDAPGDDILPAWSPDGRYLAFATARWTPRGDADADLAIVELASGRVRQLTRGPAYDSAPLWSPDGTRIAFRRVPPAGEGATLCWISYDSHRERCSRHRLPGTPLPMAWRPSGLSVDVAGGNDLPAFSWRTAVDSLDPLAEGIAYLEGLDRPARLVLKAMVAPAEHFAVVSLDQPEAAHLVQHAAFDAHRIVAFLPRRAVAGTPRFQIEPRNDTAYVGVPRRFEFLTRTPQGKLQPLDPALASWSAAPGAGATIDSVAGVFLASTAGTYTIKASAGGWSSDSIRVIAVPPRDSLLHQEIWADSSLTGWQLFGEPPPIVVHAGNGLPAVLHNGDGFFDSGLLQRAGYPARSGLALEAMVSTPITKAKWQRLNLELLSRVKVVRSGFAPEASCGFRTPEFEGPLDSATWSVSTGIESVRLPLRSEMRSGRWYRVLLQIFPGGTCGIAIDGVPLWRSQGRIDLSEDFHVAIQGQTVGTRILVGPFSLWQGIRSGIDWTRLLPTPAAPR